MFLFFVLISLFPRRFTHHVFNYKAPTVSLFQCDQNVCICVAVGEEWRWVIYLVALTRFLMYFASVHDFVLRDSSREFGGSNCHIIQVSPEFKLIKSTLRHNDSRHTVLSAGRFLSGFEWIVCMCCVCVSGGSNLICFNMRNRDVPRGLTVRSSDSRLRALHVSLDFDSIELLGSKHRLQRVEVRYFSVLT